MLDPGDDEGEWSGISMSAEILVWKPLFLLTRSRYGAICSPIKAEQVEWLLSRAFTIFCVIEVITGSSCCMSNTAP